MTINSRRTTLFATISVLFGLVIGVGLAEVAVRFLAPQQTGPIQFAWNPELGPVSVPLQQGRRRFPGEYDYTYTNNSLGFRGQREHPAAKPSGVTRVLFLGDSFTYGIGVGDDQTFSIQTEKFLNQSGLKAEVINAGVAGTGTDYALNLYMKLGRNWRPDVVALFFFANDYSDNAAHTYFTVSAEGYPQLTTNNPMATKWWTRYLPAYDWLISSSHLANLLKQVAIGYMTSGGRGEPAPGVISYAGLEDAPDSNGAEALTKTLVSTLVRAVRQAGAQAVIFYIPSEGEVTAFRAKRPVSRSESVLAGFTRTAGIPFCSLTPVIAGAQQAPEELYFHKDGHWKSTAHEIAARAITAKLRGLLPQRGEGSKGGVIEHCP